MKVCAELNQSDKARPVAKDGRCHLNPFINRTFSACLSIISSYLFLVLSASWSSQAASHSLTHTHTHSTALWCWQLLAVCAVSASSTLSHPTQPTLRPGKRLCLMGRDGWMNEPFCCNISSAVSQMVRNILARRAVGCRYLRHAHSVGVYTVIMTVCSEDCCGEASVNSTPPENKHIRRHIYTHTPLPL